MTPRVVGRLLARYLSKRRGVGVRIATCTPDTLAATLQKGDVLLVEANSRISATIKYLTQSTWSHATLFVGGALGAPEDGEEARVLVESDINGGVQAVPLSTYSNLHTRICRAVGLTNEEVDTVVQYAVSRLGYRYDLKNVFDLARYLIRKPPVPEYWRRRLIALGSGDPTRAICSALIAQAFQSVHYPILPEIVDSKSTDPACVECYDEILHVRHHSLFTPRDFDISPYFQVVKPTLKQDFDFHQFTWVE